jgi:hypothetical protein
MAGSKYGWYSRKQAKLGGTVIYLDERGNEVELSSVSEREDGRPEFDDVRLVTMVRVDGFVRRVSYGSPYAISLDEFDPYASSMGIFPMKDAKSTEKAESTRYGAKIMPSTAAGRNGRSAPYASSRKAIDEWRRGTGTFYSGAPIGKKDIKKMAEAILKSMDYDPGGMYPPADCAASALLELSESHISDLKEANIQKSLIRSLNREDRLVGNTVAKVLNNLGWTPKRYADKVAYFIATEEWDALSRMGKSAVKLLCGCVRTSDSDLYVNVARVLGDIGDARAIKDLSYCHCQDYSHTMVAPAAEALAKIGKRHFEKLVGALKETRIMNGATIIWALCEIGDRRATAAVIDWIFEHGTGADMEITMRFGNKPPSPHDLVRMMIPPQMLPNLLGDYTNLILDIFDWKPTSDAEKFDLSRCTEAVRRLCMIRTPVSDNVLSKVAKMRELAVTHIMLYSDHILKYLAVDDLRQTAKTELRRRGKPRYDPSVYLNPDAWRI